MEGVDKIVGLFNEGCSSGSSFFFIFILSSEGVAAADIDVDLSDDDHSALDFGDDSFEVVFVAFFVGKFLEFVQFVAVRDDIVIAVAVASQVDENSHASTIDLNYKLFEKGSAFNNF